MEDWYHGILEHLYKNFPLDDTKHIINDFLINNLKVDSGHPGHLHRLSSILYILYDKRYVELSIVVKMANEVERGLVLGQTAIGAGYKDANSLLTHNVILRLTIEGYVYMQARDMKLKEHSSMISTNQNSKILYRIAVAISLGSLFVSVAIYSKKDGKDDLYKQLIQTQSRLDTIKESISNLSNQIGSVKDSIKKYSSKKK